MNIYMIILTVIIKKKYISNIFFVAFEAAFNREHVLLPLQW